MLVALLDEAAQVTIRRHQRDGLKPGVQMIPHKCVGIAEPTVVLSIERPVPYQC